MLDRHGEPRDPIKSRDPTKSASDYRDYRIIHLENGIKVFLVSDIKPSLPCNSNHGNTNEIPEEQIERLEIGENAETRSAAAALYVAAGSFQEPPDVSGLAHFLEHMLFMGSEKYPEENAYDSYLQMHGGSSNAYTANESTVFYFDVQPEYFDGGLDIFSNFFISPLLTEDAVDREVKAVDSEFKGRLTDDSSRASQVLRAFAREDHPYSRFTHGNEKTLVTNPKEKGIDVMEELRLFYNTYYHTQQMILSLCSPVPLDDLETMARKHFSGIKSRTHVKLFHNVEMDDPFKSNQFHKLFIIEPVEEIHLVKFSWLLPPQQRHYKKCPASYISWLLGHRCKGSVYAYLKEKGYISSFSAYNSADCNSLSKFCCALELTERGMDNIEEVVHIVFQYISMIQNKGAYRDIFDQLVKISKNSFKYQEPDEPSDLVEGMVGRMNYLEDEDLLDAGLSRAEYDPGLIEEIQNMLSTERVNIIIMSKKYEQDYQDVEEWFKTKYIVKDIPLGWICEDKCTAKNEQLYLPDRNHYIADNFNLHVDDSSSNSEYPTIINNTDKVKVWYKPDRKFFLPKAVINFMLMTPVAHKSSYNLMCAGMLEYVLDYDLEEFCCEAAIAELGVGQGSGGKCHSISFGGFNDKLFLFFKDVIDRLSISDFTENAFNISKEEIERDYRNALIRSDDFNRTLKGLIMRNVVANPIESLKLLVDLTPDLLKDYYKEYFSQLYIESLFQGNITKDEAEAFLSYISVAFKYKALSAEDFPEMKTLCLPKGRTVCRHHVLKKKDPTSVIHNYYQIGPPSLRLLIVAALLNHVMEEPVFNTLRTKQQLGYTVYCSIDYSEGGILGFSITVKTDSGKYTADEIDGRIEDFFKTFYEILQEEKDYEKYVESYVKLLRQADLSVGDEASRNWSEIYSQDYIFDRRFRSIEMAKTIDKSELLTLMKRHILDKENVRMMSVQVIGSPSDNGPNGDEHEEEDGDVENEDDSSDKKDVVDEENVEEDKKNEDDEDLHGCEINPVDIISEQYTRSIKDITKFREENYFYPTSKISLE